MADEDAVMTYKVAEKFKSIQGEGVYAGTPMAFIRFVGCSVGKRICQHCDTDFDNTMPWRGGGEFTTEQLLTWALPYRHICFTGGEPLNQDFTEIIDKWCYYGRVDTGDGFTIPMMHVETSGTVDVSKVQLRDLPLWLCVSPKPGWNEENIRQADEVKIIVPGLGDVLPKADPGTRMHNFVWPTIQDALRWYDLYPGKPIFLQPRNSKFALDKNNLVIVQDLLREYPQFRLSLQLHKLLGVQ